jgi:hypothetical protein
LWTALALACLNLTTWRPTSIAGLLALIFVILVGLVAGLTLGILALVAARKHGPDGILVAAVVGVTLNGVFLVLLAAVSASAWRT